MENEKAIQDLQREMNRESRHSVKTTPRDTIRKYLYHLPLFLISLAICLGTTYLYLRYKNPIYNSSIDILLKDDEENGNDLSKQILSELTGSGQTNIANEMRIIQTTSLMEKVVRKNNFNAIFTSKGNVRDVELYEQGRLPIIAFKTIRDSSLVYKVQFEVKNNKIHYIKGKHRQEVNNHSLIREKKFDFVIQLEKDLNKYKPNYTYTASWYPPEKISEILASQIKVKSPDLDASIINITLLSENGAKARHILNDLVETYTQANIEEKNKTIDNTLNFINERLLLISSELGGVENTLQNYRQQNIVIDVPTQGQQDIERLATIQDKMDQSQVKLQVTDMISNYVNNSDRKYNLVPSSLGIEDITLLRLVEGYNEGVIKREELLKTVAPGNIAIVSLENQLDQLRIKVVENISNIRKTYQTTFDAASREYSRILNNVKSIPGKQKSLLQIERQQGIKEKLYVYLMEKREEAAITRASATANSKSLDPAKTALAPVSPNVVSLYCLALLFGIGIPVSIISIKDLFKDKVTTRTDISQYTRTPIIGEINHVTSKESKLISPLARNVLSEQFRIIRTNLSFFLKEQMGSTILLTSTMPNEGKTFVCMNLGAVLAMSGKKVVLLEFDLRKPQLSSSLGMNSSTLGITNFLTRNMSAQELLKPIAGFDNYFLISSGPIPPNAGDLILDKKVNMLFDELKKSFDYIIIDTPPVGIVSDARILSAFSYLNLYVVRQRFTAKKQMEFVDELYVNKIFSNMSLIVNDLLAKGSNSYYGYSRVHGYSNYNYDNSYEYGHNGKGGKLTILKGLRKAFRKDKKLEE